MSVCERLTMGTAGMVVRGAGGAGITAAMVATGAKILQDAGHDGYSVCQGAAAGAIGGAVISSAFGLVHGLLSPQTVLAPSETKALNIVRLGAAAAESVVNTVTGAAILSAAKSSHIGFLEAARASAVGAAVIVGGSIVLIALCS